MNKYRKIFSVIPTHLILIFFAIVALIPIWIIFISSIKPHVEVYKNQIAFPNKTIKIGDNNILNIVIIFGTFFMERV